jgi:hypothetical protein
MGCRRAGDLVEPLRASAHFLGGRQAEAIEHHLDSMQPVVPERGFPSIVAPNRPQSLRLAVQLREDTANIGRTSGQSNCRLNSSVRGASPIITVPAAAPS